MIFKSLEGKTVLQDAEEYFKGQISPGMREHFEEVQRCLNAAYTQGYIEGMQAVLQMRADREEREQ